MNINDIGIYLQTKRKEHGFTQSELANMMNVSHQAVSRWENGENLPDIIKLSELSKIYGITIDEIIGEEKDDSMVKRNNKASELSIYTIINAVVSLLSVILVFIILGTSSVELWVPITIQYILVVGISLIYLIPFSKIKDKLKKDYVQLRLSLLFSFGALIFTIIPFSYGNGNFDNYFEESLLGSVIITVFALYILNLIIEINEQNQLNLEIKLPLLLNWNLDPKEVVRAIIYFFIALSVLASTLYFGDNVILLNVLIYLIVTTVLVTLVYTIFNLSIVNISLFTLYLVTSMQTLFFSYYSGNFSNHDEWQTFTSYGGYFENILGPLSAFVLVVTFTYFIYKKDKFIKFKKSITFLYLIIIFQTFSKFAGGGTFSQVIQTEDGLLISNILSLDFTIENIIYTEAIVILVAIYMIQNIVNRIKKDNDLETLS